MPHSCEFGWNISIVEEEIAIWTDRDGRTEAFTIFLKKPGVNKEFASTIY